MKNVSLYINSPLTPPVPQPPPPFPQSVNIINTHKTVQVNLSVQFEDEKEGLVFARDLLNFINDYDI